LSALLEHAVATDKFGATYDYRAYEPEKELSEEVRHKLSTAYGSLASGRIATTKDELDHLDDGTVDVAVMCNVLHEIDPRLWVGEIGPKSVLARKLAPSGFLMLVEDQRMPVGERAHRLGFVVLHEASVRRLFMIAEADTDFSVCSRDDGRLTAFMIPMRMLSRVTSDSRREALRVVMEHAKERIGAMRTASENGPVTYREGRQHALLLQLFANAQLALDEG
jgi:hypothetical protein